MKLTKRLILAVLCIALVLTSTLLVVTACDQEETGFKVTVAEYDNQQGTVSVSSPAEGKLYDNGEKVTVTVTPATDYKVATFAVSGHDDATLNNEGKYEFEISSDTTVTVTFVQNQPEPTTFTVTVGSVQNGTVKLDPEKDAYTEGESVTVTVTPASGYEVTTFTVSGHDDATLNDEGKYTFQVTGNTTVSATFSLIPETATVTVVEGEGTHIELSPEARKEEKTADGVVYTFVAGTDVTVSVTFDEGFVLDLFYVNKAEEELNEDNEYKFTVLEDATIEVVADRPFTQELLDSLKGTLKIEGELNEYHPNSDTSYISKLGATYDVKNGLVWQWELYDGEYISNLVLKADEDGNVIVPNRQRDGSVVWSHPVNSREEEVVVPFSDFIDPFDVLEVSGFIYVGENTWELTDLELAAEVASAISNYDYTSRGVTSFQLVGEDNVVTTIKYTTGEALDSNYNTYVHIADLTISERGTATVPAEMTEAYPEQQELEQALQAARDAVTYTVHYTDDSEEYPEEYTLYRAEKAIWIDDGEDPYALVERPDGTVWELVYGKDGKTFEFYSNEAVSPSLHNISALFDLTGFSSSFFVETEEGVYTLRPADVSLAPYFAICFATAYQLEVASYATNITITLDNGVLSSVGYDYVMVSSYGYILDSGHVVIEFSNFGQTTVPATVELPADLINGKFATDVLGTWLDDENGSRIDITMDSITIDGVETSKIVANEDSTYTITVGKETYTVKKTENGKLSVQSSKGTVEYRFRVTPWEDLIGEYSGVEDYSEDYGWKIQLAITAEGLTLTLDGESDTLTPDDFTFVEDGDTVGIYFPVGTTEYGDTVYAFIVCLLKSKIVYFYGEDDYYGDTYFAAYLYSEDYVVDFSGYYGTFTLIGGEDTITISESGITMVLNGETIEVLAKDIEYYPVEYPARLFRFVANDVQYTVQQYGSSFDRISLFVDGKYNGTFVTSDYQHPDWSQYVGTFNGEDEEGNEYEVVITEDEVVFKKNGQDQTITNIDFDRYLLTDGWDDFWLYQFDFFIGDVSWGLQQTDEGTDYNTLFLFFEGEEDITTVCVMYRDQYQEIEDYSEYYGTYQNGDTKVVISAEGITVTVEGVDVTATTEVVFASNYDYDSESVYYQFVFTWNGKTCILQVCDEGDAMLFVVDPESETSQVIVLVNSDYVAPDLSKDSGFINRWSRYYETADGLSTITITDKGEIQVVLGGQPVEIAQVVYYGAEGGLLIKLSGRIYQLYIGYDSDYNYVIVAVDEDGTELEFKQAFPVVDQSWESFLGTWTGTYGVYSDQGYVDHDVVLVISDGAVTMQIDGGEVKNGINPKLRNAEYYLLITFTIDGVNYKVRSFDSETPYLNLSDYGYNITAYLYRLNWNDLVGFYDNEAGDRDTDGEVCYITIQPTSITIQIQGSSPVTIEASDIEFKIEDNGEFTYSVFYFTYNDVECMLMELSEGGLMFTDIDFEDKYYIIVYLNGVVGGGDSDSPWPDFDGFWTGTTDEQEPRSVAIEIDGEYIFLTVGDDDGFEAINPSLVGSVLSFMCGGEEYTLTIVGDQLRVYNGTWEWEAMCDKFEQGGGDKGDWSEFNGVWEGSDEITGNTYKVEFNSVTGRIDVTLKGEDGYESFMAYNIQIGQGLNGTKVTFVANETTYIFEDDGFGGARFHDEDGDVDVTLTRKGSDSGDGDEVDYSYYIGEYFSDDNTSDTKVEIVITKDSITIKIDGVEQNVTVVSYTADTDGFKLDIDGKTWYVYSMDEGNIKAVWFTDNGSTSINCSQHVG